MNDGKERGSHDDRAESRAAAQKQTKKKSAKKRFLQNRHHAGRQANRRHLRPEKGVSQRVDVQCNQDCAAAEQGNCSDNKTCGDIGTGSPIFLETKVVPATQAE